MQAQYHKWLVLISTGPMILLVNIDGTIVSLALARIAESLDANLTSIQWVIAAYLLSTAIFFTIFGRLADMFGEKRIFLIGATIFTLASLACGLSKTETMLIVARFIQGLGFAATLSISLVMITHAFPPEQKGLAGGIAITLTGLGQVLGPTLGGIILTIADWPWIFLINIPAGIFSIIMTLIFVPKDMPKTSKQPLSYLNIFLYITGIGIVIFTLNELAVFDLTTIVTLLITGILITAIFVIQSFKTKAPLVALELLTHKEFMLITLSRTLYMYVFLSLLFFVPLFLQNTLEYSPLKTSMLMITMSVMVAILSPLTGKYCDKYGFKKPTVISMIFAGIAFIAFSLLHQNSTLWILLIALITFGISCGLHIPATINGIVKNSPEAHKSTGMGLFFSIAFLGATMGVALSGSFVNARSTTLLTQALANQPVTLTAEALIDLKMVASGTHSAAWLQAQASIPNTAELTNIAQNAFVTSFNEMAWINLLLLIIGVFIATRLKSTVQRQEM